MTGTSIASINKEMACFFDQLSKLNRGLQSNMNFLKGIYILAAKIANSCFFFLMIFTRVKFLIPLESYGAFIKSGVFVDQVQSFSLYDNKVSISLYEKLDHWIMQFKSFHLLSQHGL